MSTPEAIVHVEPAPPSPAQIVIVAYRPKTGREQDLLALSQKHLPLLRAEGLATARTPVLCQAVDGTVIEVFEWAAGGQERAHHNPRVQALWARYVEVCEYVPLTAVEEAHGLFAGFKPL